MYARGQKLFSYIQGMVIAQTQNISHDTVNASKRRASTLAPRTQIQRSEHARGGACVYDAYIPEALVEIVFLFDGKKLFFFTTFCSISWACSTG